MSLASVLTALQCLSTRSNLFSEHAYYVNDVYRQRVQALSLATFVDEPMRSNLDWMFNLGSAVWIDRISKIDAGANRSSQSLSLHSVFADASRAPNPPLVVAVLYNLPNRDCHALASNGELCCQYAADGTCTYAALDEACRDGLDRYKHEYVDAFAAVLEHHPTVPAAIIIEPDSIANLATNTADWNCGNPATQAAYLQGIRYAIESLARRAPRAALYLDAAHGGWLGWPDKVDVFLETVARIGDTTRHLRGFATNVANYQPLGTPCPATVLAESWPQLGPQYCEQHDQRDCCNDPCGLLAQFSSGNNEHNYVQLLAARLLHMPALRSWLPDPRFVIDTSRNGRDGERSSCSNWCFLTRLEPNVWPLLR